MVLFIVVVEVCGASDNPWPCSFRDLGPDVTCNNEENDFSSSKFARVPSPVPTKVLRVNRLTQQRLVVLSVSYSRSHPRARRLFSTRDKRCSPCVALRVARSPRAGPSTHPVPPFERSPISARMTRPSRTTKARCP